MSPMVLRPETVIHMETIGKYQEYAVYLAAVRDSIWSRIYLFDRVKLSVKQFMINTGIEMSIIKSNFRKFCKPDIHHQVSAVINS